MFFQIKVPTKAFPARPARKRLLVVVRVHVEGQVVNLVKGFAADRALELFLTAVRQFVVFVIA